MSALLHSRWDKMALSGVRVIEMAGLAPAPLAGMILSGNETRYTSNSIVMLVVLLDFGATVVRVDRPGQPPIDTLTRFRCRSVKMRTQHTHTHTQEEYS